MNLKQIYAIEQKNKQRILKVCPNADERSGIYIFHREENGFKYAYVGQAKHLLTRLAQHLSGYQHIDLSIKKHGFYSKDNETGYQIDFYYCGEDQLDEYEQRYILFMANKGYQLRNKTLGGQGKGKAGIAENKPSKGYYDGLKQGYKNAQRDVAKWVKWLKIDCDRSKKRAAQALERFKEFLEGEDGRG
jgi:hypothetical protein